MLVEILYCLFFAFPKFLSTCHIYECVEVCVGSLGSQLLVTFNSSSKESLTLKPTPLPGTIKETAGDKKLTAEELRKVCDRKERDHLCSKLQKDHFVILFLLFVPSRIISYCNCLAQNHAWKKKLPRNQLLYDVCMSRCFLYSADSRLG